MSTERYRPILEELSLVDLSELFEAIEAELASRGNHRLAGLVAITRHDIRRVAGAAGGEESR